MTHFSIFFPYFCLHPVFSGRFWNFRNKEIWKGRYYYRICQRLILKKELNGKINKQTNKTIKRPQQIFYSLLKNIVNYFFSYEYFREANRIMFWSLWVLRQCLSVLIQLPSKVYLSSHRNERYIMNTFSQNSFDIRYNDDFGC